MIWYVSYANFNFFELFKKNFVLFGLYDIIKMKSNFKKNKKGLKFVELWN